MTILKRNACLYTCWGRVRRVRRALCVVRAQMYREKQFPISKYKRYFCYENMYTVHCTLYNVQSTMYTMYNVHCTLYKGHSFIKKYTVHCILCTLYIVYVQYTSIYIGTMNHIFLYLVISLYN